jgi:hypothetical protein
LQHRFRGQLIQYDVTSALKYLYFIYFAGFLVNLDEKNAASADAVPLQDDRILRINVYLIKKRVHSGRTYPVARHGDLKPASSRNKVANRTLNRAFITTEFGTG